MLWLQLDASVGPTIPNGSCCTYFPSAPEMQSAAMDCDGETTTPKHNMAQLRYMKPLLGASSRLGRTLAELFGLLVKLSVGTQVRQRRGQNIVSTAVYPSPSARSVAAALNYLLDAGLDASWIPNDVMRFKLTFLICSMGFTAPMLFDERCFPYYLMLEKFVSRGGRMTFFKTFKWVLSVGGTVPVEEGLEHTKLPIGKF